MSQTPQKIHMHKKNAFIISHKQILAIWVVEHVPRYGPKCTTIYNDEHMPKVYILKKKIPLSWEKCSHPKLTTNTREKTDNINVFIPAVVIHNSGVKKKTLKHQKLVFCLKLNSIFEKENCAIRSLASQIRGWR